MVALVGSTGFVGSNILAEGAIDRAYHSTDIGEAYGTQPDVLIYAGMRAEKYLANTNPEADMELVREAQRNIEAIAPKKLVLISTIDVFREPNGKNEDAEVETDGLHAYGLNRYRLEQWARQHYSDALIVRLPGLYGRNIKKNFIYDYLNVIPFMLKENKLEELAARDGELRRYYELQANGFYKCRQLTAAERDILKEKFKMLGFTALNFTDSRNVYQFYPLSRLWSDIQTALKDDLTMLHPATAPVSAGEVYERLTGREFVNEIADVPVYYDYRTKYASLFGGHDGYLMDKEQVLTDIVRFVGGVSC